MNTEQRILARLRARPKPAGIPDHVILPDYDDYSIVRIPALVRHALGLVRDSGPLIQDAMVPDVDRVVLLILDGLGFLRLRQLLDQEPDLMLHQLAQRGTLLPITTVFPATTATALTTYCTGLPPVSHGMIGYRLYLREISAITNMISFTVAGANGNSALSAGLDLSALLPQRTVYETLASDGVESHTLLPGHIIGSGLSKLLYRGSSHLHPVVNFADMATMTRQILDAAQGKTLITLYWPGLDSIAHTRGPHAEAYEAEARTIDATLRNELVGRAENTLLILCADHGFVTMEEADYLDLDAFPRVRDESLLRPVGEPRASYVYLRSQPGPSKPWKTRELLRGDLLLLDAEDLIEIGLLGHGEEHPETRHRLGDLALLSTGSAGLYQPYPDAPLLRGMHGGLTEDEMLVPLLTTLL